MKTPVSHIGPNPAIHVLTPHGNFGDTKNGPHREAPSHVWVKDIIKSQPPIPMEFTSFNKIPRLFKECVITEKIDGTNGLIQITEDGQFLVGSRSRWITPDDDNYGFARWAYDREAELRTLGVGSHYGEWWGGKIQRGYGIKEKRFSLFNTSRWTEERPACCHVVPVLWSGLFSTDNVITAMNHLAGGSVAAPGWTRPEGIIVHHAAANSYFKHTYEQR